MCSSLQLGRGVGRCWNLETETQAEPAMTCRLPLKLIKLILSSCSAEYQFCHRSSGRWRLFTYFEDPDSYSVLDWE
jgi:hypothetical protein